MRWAVNGIKKNGTMIKFYTFIIVLFYSIPMSYGQLFPFQELTIDELIEFEKNHGSVLEKLDENEVISFLSNQTYPYSSRYKIGNPYQGNRSVNSDSIETRISAYYDRDSKKVKYLNYSLSPKAKSIEEIALELQAEGGYNRDEFIRRLNEQEQSETYQNRIINAYDNVLDLLDENGEKMENRNDVDESSLVNHKTYKVENAIVEIGIINIEELNRSVSIRIYWQ